MIKYLRYDHDKRVLIINGNKVINYSTIEQDLGIKIRWLKANFEGQYLRLHCTDGDYIDLSYDELERYK